MNIKKTLKRLRPSYAIMKKLGHTPGQVITPDDLATILSDKETFNKDERKWARLRRADAVRVHGHVMAKIDKEAEDRALVLMRSATD